MNGNGISVAQAAAALQAAYGGRSVSAWDDPVVIDAITDAIATEDRRVWLDPDDVGEMVDDVVRCLRDLFGGAQC